jgi:DNA-binding MarR family transcriptional regulator
MSARRRRRNSLLESLEIFRKQHPSFTLGMIVTFLYACENEGASVRDLAGLCGLADGTVSRNVRSLAPADEPGALPPCAGLLTLRDDPHDARLRLVHLTEAGRSLRARLDDIIRAAVRTDGVGADAR